MKRLVSWFMSICLSATLFSGMKAAAVPEQTDFYSELTEAYSSPVINDRSEVRWWMAQGMHTDETIREELQAIRDAGFRGIELCQLSDSNIDSSVYGYGSEQWNHDFRLALETALDLGMTVSLTSGAGWSTANIPGLDPNSQAANQSIFELNETLTAGSTRTGALPTSANLNPNAEFIGAYAYRKTTATSFAKDSYIIQTRENQSDPTTFTIEGDFIIDKENTSICFGVRDINRDFLMWQINTVQNKSGRVLLRPHVRAGGAWKSSQDIDVTNAIGYSSSEIIGKTVHIKIAVENGSTVKTYFNNGSTPASVYTIPSTAAKNENGDFTLGKLMFRQSSSARAGTEEIARWDNISVKDGGGNIIFEETFVDPDDMGFAKIEGAQVVDGMLKVGLQQYAGISSDTIVDSEYRTVQTKPCASDPYDFSIEGDFIIDSENTSICFGGRDNNKSFLMWQINTKVNGSDQVLCRPHVCANGKWSSVDYNITDAIGYRANELIGKRVHIKIVVTDGKTVDTYFGGSDKSAFTYTIPDNAVRASSGKFTVGNLLFRHKTSSKYKNNEQARWDNIEVRDGNGVIVFSQDFEDASSVGFQLSESARIVDGMLSLGILQADVIGGDNVFIADEYIDLTSLVQNGTLAWTAPYNGDYVIRYYWQQGSAQRANPSSIPAYCINYFDGRGVEALKAYWTENVLNDSELNKKIKNGDVQLFMDSLEYNSGKGFTMWPQGFDSEFEKRKGYDIKPYMYLAVGAPNTSIWGWSNNADLHGTYSLTDSELQKKIINDIFDVQTELYMENFMAPFREWLNSYGIKLRAQISYGQNLEISEPIQSVDYPEAENRNQRNQPDMYRLWSGGAHLQNKVLSSEIGGLNSSAYTYTYQRHLQEAYTQYASGYNRVVWHIWSSLYGPTPSWPGYEGGMAQFYKFGTREPSATEYGEFNDHLGRIQRLLREGKSATDIGMVYMKYGQHLVYGTQDDWLRRHSSLFFPSTKLQDNGYTYDYFSPDFLTADNVYYDKASGTLELAGYKAVVLWQDVLTVDGAGALLDLAKQGLRVIIVDGAAVKTPYNDGGEAELERIMSELRALDSVASVKSADDVLGALENMGVTPYAGFEKSNQQLLTQVRRDGDNRYLYLYNYCDGSLHNSWNEDHGDVITTDIVMDGTFVPYMINSWTGEVTELAQYRYENGKTVFPVTLKYGDISLFAFESVMTEEHETRILRTDADSAYVSGGKMFIRAKNSGSFKTYTSDGCVTNSEILVPGAFDITGWELRVESWSPGKTVSRSETLPGSQTETVEYAVDTAKREISVSLDTLRTWDEIPEIGKNVSGKGTYTAKFVWDGSASGAYIDFGRIIQSMQVFVNGIKTVDVNMNNPVVDISDLLEIGENEIKVIYSSNLTNVQISRGIVSDGVVPNNYLGYDTTYYSYGPERALVVPFIEREITGHDWNEGKITKAPTCSAAGEKTYTCKNDPTHTRTEAVPIDPLAHSWGEYVYNNDATYESDGTKTRVCGLCGKAETVTAEGTKLIETITPVDSSEKFTDVEGGRWYKPYIDYAATYGLMNGVSDKEFAPSLTLTRAMFVQILANMSGIDTDDRNVQTAFDDVPSGKWYSAAVKWAADNKIVNGTSPTSFSPNDPVQRQQICTMIVRYAEFAGITLDGTLEKSEFEDDGRIQNYAKEAVYICQRAGIVNGMDEKTFAPRDNATRAQVAAIIQRFHEKFLSK